MKFFNMIFSRRMIMWFFAASFSIFATSVYAETTTVTVPKVTDRYAQLSKDVKLFYHDSGKGPVMVFVPGWTMSSEVFKAQMAYFNKKYRVITLDPRSQGRSSITLENNDYTQHGADLARFFDVLGLKKVVLVAWSWGCNVAYAYMRLKGVDNLRAFVCIDASPKPSGGKKEWARNDYPNWGTVIVQPMMYNRDQFTPVWVQSMVERKLKPQEQAWMVKESLRTPTYAAMQLALDAIYADYRPEAKLLNSRGIPTLNFVSQQSSVNAAKWLKANAPNSQIKIMGKHLMFWEHPEEFNQTLNTFLEGINSPHSNTKEGSS